MKHKSFDENELKFLFEYDEYNNGSMKNITVLASAVISILNNPEQKEHIPDGFYLLCINHSIHKTGTIVEFRHGVVHYERKKCQNDENEYNAASMLKIEKDEVAYLMKIPIDDRLKNHELGIFAKIKNLGIGNKCRYENDEWTIVAKNIGEDGTKFDLRHSMNKGKRSFGVDASKILLEESTLEIVPNKQGSQRQSSSQNSLSGTGRYKQTETTSDFTSASDVLPFGKAQLKILNHGAIKKIESQPEKFDKFIVIRKKKEDSVVKLLWKGIVDDKICLGVDLLQECAGGTDGAFNGEQLFTCNMGFGALIPIKQDGIESCEFGIYHTHLKDLDLNHTIKEDEMCCLETINKFESAGIEIENSVAYGKDSNKRGIVKWLGLVNGKECVGLVCEECPKKYKAEGLVHQTGLFTDPLDKISIMDIRSIKVEKVFFTVDRIVDLGKILCVKTVDSGRFTKNDFNGIDMGDPVATEISGRQYIGEVKWLGVINNDKCVGLDMEHRFEFGMNGRITDAIKFTCLEGHGVVTVLENVELSQDRTPSTLLKNGIIDPKKYLKCEEEWEKNFLEERKLRKDDLVSIRMDLNGDVKIKGTLRWCGFMNEMLVGAVELTGDHENGTNGMFWRNQLFRCSGRRGIALPWDRIFRDITVPIKNENMELEIISPLIRDLKIDPVKFDERNLILKKGGVELSVALLWKGNVDDHLCIGCELKSDFETYGTNGKYDSQQLFECTRGRGVLIKLNYDIDTCERKQLHQNVFIIPWIFNPNGICCFKTLGALSQHRDIRIGDQVAMKIRNGLMDVTCKWIGLVNNKEAIMIREEIDYGKDKLPKWKLESFMSGTVVIADSIIPYVPIFEKDIFAKSSNKFTNWVKLNGFMDFGIGELVEVRSRPVLYGQIRFGVERSKEVLAGIQLDEDQIHKHHEFLKEILFGESFFEKGTLGIIVKINALEKFNGNIELERDSYLIKKSSIKYKIRFPAKDFLKNEFVQSLRNPVEYLVTTDSFLIYGIPCFEVTKGIMADEPDAVEYVKQADVRKIRSIPTTCYEGAITIPRSVLTFEKWEDENLKIGDKVSFKLRTSLGRFQGTVKWIGKANGVPSSVVELEGQYNEEMKKFSINDRKRFTKFSSDPGLNLVIVENYLLAKQKRVDLVEVSGIPVIMPVSVNVSSGKMKNNEKTIVFQCNNVTRSGLLKWKGIVDKRFFLGCELIFDKSPYGTDGKFAQVQLFRCKEKRGFLIPLDLLKECCVKDGHKPIMVNAKKIIDANRICCIKPNEKLTENMGIRINDRVKMKNSKETGICNWIGLVNNVPVFGLEMNEPVNEGTDGTFCDIKLFDCLPKFGVLGEVSEFEKVAFTLVHLDDFQMDIVNPADVKLIENGGVFHIAMNVKFKKGPNFVNIKWKGCINGYFCFGCELISDSPQGTDGTFAGQKLFSSNGKRAVIIPFDQLKDSCESSGHKEISKEKKGYLWKSSFPINPECMCCAEWKENIPTLPLLKNDSRIKVTHKDREIFGICRWIGLINGVESVGIEMDTENGGRDGQFGNFELFRGAKDKGFLCLAADVIHDLEKEKLHFLEDKIVDLSKTFRVQILNVKDNGINIGDPVGTEISGRRFIGEVKWLGIINNKKCVGLDMEDQFDFGMNGKIRDAIKFTCLEGHGVVTLLKNVELSKDRTPPTLLENGIIDPNKYLKCEEKWDKDFLVERKVKKGGLVWIKMDLNGVVVKIKGTLKWCGFMNGMPVAAVELTGDHENGTDGIFWRNQLFRCSGRRAIAVPSKHIFQYEPYETKQIPQDILPIKNINLNSAVKYYHHDGSGIKDLFGTVKWSGMNENGEYLWGIELDDRLSTGTDGVFKGQRLFNCLNGHGVLAPLNRTARDTRFEDSEVDEKDVEKSKESQFTTTSILSKLSHGEKKGIQGNANSCYFDSAIFALFSKSDVLDYMISPMINEDETNEITKEFRAIMAWKIIYPLREYGFVSFHQTQEMRKVIERYGSKFAEMTKQESDMANVSALLCKLCPKDQLLSIKSHQGNILKSVFIQLFVNVKKAEFMTSEDMLKISMVQNDIMFEKLPTCLIMQAPRDATGTNCYENAFPFNTIEISQICSDYFKKCFQCDEEASFQCKECMKTKEWNISTSFLCRIHECSHEDKMKIPKNPVKSKSKVFMELKSIICIDKCHFVSFVKQIENGNKPKWYFFDSMSTQNIANNYSIPKVTLAKDESDFLNLEDHEKQTILRYNVDKIKRILKDSYIFVYENSAKTCY